MASDTHKTQILGAALTPPAGRPYEVLALGNLLQTTLELDELIDLFRRELASFVSFDGLSYRHSELGQEILRGRKERHHLDYGLRVQDRFLGEITLFRERPFADREIEILENLLAALLYPLRNSLLYQAALRSALKDPLTGLNNRAAMDTMMRREVRLAQRKQSPLAVILADIDHFKKINDGYGHVVGDHCLQTVAHTLAESIRDSDLVFRYGGEEFLILLGQTDRDGARLLAERIRRKVAELHVPGHPEHRLGLSLGVAELLPDEDGLTLCKRADAALYRAKRGGRNRVEVD